MVQTKYKRIKTDADVHTEIDDENDDGEHHSHIIDENITKIEMPSQKMNRNIMHVMIGTIILILIYFCLSIGLTFYQGRLFKVNTHSYLFYLLFFL